MDELDVSLLRGTLDLLILKAVSWGPRHGYAVAEWIGEATGGVASVQIARSLGSTPGQVTSHTSDILFAFVLSGSVTLHGDGQGAHALSEGDAFVIPPDLPTSLTGASPDLQLLEVSLPAQFETRVHPGVRLT